MKTAYEYNKELIQTITPSMSYKGENIESYKLVARKKLYELLGLEKFKKVKPDTKIEYTKKIEGGTEIRFTFESEKGYRIPCHLLIPDNIENPSLAICLQGHSKGMHISLGRPKYEGDEKSIEGDRDFAIRALKEGFCAVVMEQRNFGECGGNEDGPQCLESAMTALIMGRTTIAERVWDVSRLIDVLETEFKDKYNNKKICCIGNSGGGTATAYASALDDRIFLAVPSCAMCTYKDSIGAMNHCTCNYVPKIAEFFEMSDLMVMAYPKYYIQISGINDPIFPIKPAEQVFNKGYEAYKINNCKDRCVLIKGNGGHRFYADDAWTVIKKFTK